MGLPSQFRQPGLRPCREPSGRAPRPAAALRRCAQYRSHLAHRYLWLVTELVAVSTAGEPGCAADLR